MDDFQSLICAPFKMQMSMSARLIVADLIFARFAMPTDGSLHSFAHFFGSDWRVAVACARRARRWRARAFSNAQLGARAQLEAPPMLPLAYKSATASARPPSIRVSTRLLSACSIALFFRSLNCKMSGRGAGGKGGGKAKTGGKAKSRSSRAGLQFPVGRLHRLLRKGLF